MAVAKSTLGCAPELTRERALEPGPHAVPRSKLLRPPPPAGHLDLGVGQERPPLGLLLALGGVGLAGLVIWIILVLKANQGQMYKLPMIGDMAEKQANAI